jgi:hypothetical protein
MRSTTLFAATKRDMTDGEKRKETAPAAYRKWSLTTPYSCRSRRTTACPCRLRTMCPTSNCIRRPSCRCLAALVGTSNHPSSAMSDIQTLRHTTSTGPLIRCLVTSRRKHSSPGAGASGCERASTWLRQRQPLRAHASRCSNDPFTALARRNFIP